MLASAIWGYTRDVYKRQEEKTFCSNCTVHCYRPEMRERIRTVMRYAGPRKMCIRDS